MRGNGRLACRALHTLCRLAFEHARMLCQDRRCWLGTYQCAPRSSAPVGGHLVQGEPRGGFQRLRFEIPLAGGDGRILSHSGCLVLPKLEKESMATRGSMLNRRASSATQSAISARSSAVGSMLTVASARK